MSATYFDVDIMNLNPLADEADSQKGFVLKKWLEIQAESTDEEDSSLAKSTLDRYWGPSSVEKKACPLDNEFYFVYDGDPCYKIRRDVDKSPYKEKVAPEEKPENGLNFICPACGEHIDLSTQEKGE